MINHDCDILFKRIKDVALIQPYRSKKFIEFVKWNSKKQTFHHACGSLGPLKSTDLLGVGADMEEHIKGELNRDWIIEQVPKAVKNLIDYTVYLEQQIEELKGSKNEVQSRS